ncbi:MAG TPA: MBOAT family protein [Candidatus Hydrogenedentes bacterium]|jgi:alginate O-acetyltransferase complex protein AlgI|nr:MBOAT family protein [Candidatus Hydrogenedentota bacterium]MDY0031276.1 MBOAT family protein [FCB group bacterium]NLT59746.1 MBOAT family protein [Candidatus Hydrogenedentota bacterium]HNV21642.1 MBOAT family protein [Candidatus Hydrogenedentota bacterium]HNZ18824.1 MBOAT family protein [Candidatus Hydrogenedentota bacterium]
MVFTSHIFVFYFLPLVLLAYYAVPWKRNLLLLFASYIFYGWWDPRFVALMFLATLANYVCGGIIARAPHGSRTRHAALVAAVAISLGMLGFFKYFVFAQNNLNALVVWFGGTPFPVLQVVLPVGISFFVFQSLSYSIDVYRGESPPVRSLADFACFVALFPQLIAGPIVRYNTIAEQLVEREHSLDKFACGTALFILGFAKKVLLANAMGAVADAVFGAETRGCLDAWFGVCAYAFQIYYDFSGYSDMAIGLGRMFGFEFLRNFDSPYLADSITDFWRRWHISLSTFLRDYLYIPLGGNRKGPWRTYANLAIVMLLGGLWHGASWVFVIWGAYHGFLLAFERWRGKESVYARLPRQIRVGFTFVLVLFSWVLFRSPTLAEAGAYFQALFALSNADGSPALLAGELYTRGNVGLMALCALVAFQRVQAFDWVQRMSWPRLLLVLAVFVYSLLTMFVQAFNPFLYFQF